MNPKQQRDYESAWWHSKQWKLVPPKKTRKGMRKTDDPHANANPAYDKFYYAAKDGDVVISLSTYEKDSLLVPSSVLTEKSSWFKASLSTGWVAQKTTGSGGLKRYELEFDADKHGGGCMLSGKNEETPTEERLWAAAAALNTVPLEEIESDEHELRIHIRWDWHHKLRNTPGESLVLVEEAAMVAVHKLGLSMLLGMELQLRMTNKLKSLPGLRTYVLTELLTWIDVYGNFKDTDSMKLLVEFILKPDFAADIEQYPCTYLRFACLARSKEIFKVALNYAQYQGLLAQKLGGDVDLVERVYKHKEWTENEMQRLWRQVATTRLNEHPAATSGTATDIFRLHIIYDTDYQSILSQIFTRSADIDRILQDWPRRTYRDKPLPKHINPIVLRQKLVKVFRLARDVMGDVRGCRVMHCPRLWPPLMLELGELHWHNYEYPWQRKLPETESEITAMLAMASLDYGDEEDSNSPSFT